MNADRAEAERLRAAHDAGEPGARQAIRAALKKYRFYHCIEVAPGIETGGIEGTRIYVERFRAAGAAIDFRGKSVLDVGCRDGAMLFAAEEAGAAELVGADNDASPGLADFLVPFRRSKIETIEANLYDLTPAAIGRFDIVICCGLLYHLRYPGWGMRTLAGLLVEGGTLILETGLLDGLADLPILFRPSGAASPYEPTSPSFFNLAGAETLLAAAGLSKPVVRERFSPLPFDAEKHFPGFAAAFQARMTITRTIVTATKQGSRPGLDAYFEGTHRLHSERPL